MRPAAPHWPAPLVRRMHATVSVLAVFALAMPSLWSDANPAAASSVGATSAAGQVSAPPPAATHPPAVAGPEPGGVPLFLVMDTSGSMEGARIIAARAAARAVIGKLDPGRTYGMYQYPAGRKQVDGCSVGRWRTEPGAVSYWAATTDAATLEATGGTPTGPALLEFSRSLELRGITRAIAVLVSDGEANCGDTDICSIATVLKQKQIDLIFNTVSFDNSLQGDAQLACLAAATGGRAFTVDQTEDLSAAIGAAAAYAAKLTAEVPDPLPIATGEGSTAASDMTVSVTNTGTATIPDALLTISVNSPDPAARRVRVPDPLHRLGNLAPGVTVTWTVRLFPEATKPGPVTWQLSLSSRSIPIASADGTVQVATDSSLRSAGAILRDAKSVVVLGDSYSSGEGAGSYDPDPYEHCHRSRNAWGRLLYQDADLIACSGAVTTDLTTPNHGDADLEAQLLSLAKVTAGGAPPDLLLLTLGGNDAGFGDVVAACAKYSACDGGRAMSKVKWDGLQTSLETAYRDINAVVNAPSVIARRGRVAQIVVLPYMRALPQTGGNGCAFGFSSKEIPMLNEFQAKLNNSVSRATAHVLINDGIPIHFAGPVADAFQPNHTICDDDPYLKVPTRDTWWEVLPLIQKQELFHPNAKGQKAVAASLVEWSRTSAALPLAKPAAPYEDIKIVTYDWIRQTTALGTVAIEGHPIWGQVTRSLTSLVPLPLMGWITEPGAEIVGVPGCTKATCGYDSGPIYVTLFSNPIPIGTLRVDADGIHGSVTIPPDTAPGTHTLLYEGRGTGGRSNSVKVPVRIWRQGTGAASVAAGGGLVLSLTGALVLWRRPRPVIVARKTADPAV